MIDASPAARALRTQGLAELASHSSALMASHAYAIVFTALWWAVARGMLRLGWRLRF